MRKVVGMLVAAMFVLGVVFTAQAVTLDEAKALGEKAAAYVKANGKDKGIAEISNPKGQFVKGNLELYVTLHDVNGVTLANPANPKLHGQNHTDLKDPTGKLFVKEAVELVKSKGSGWTTYSWTNPLTKKVQPKKAWVQRIEGTDMYTLCGVWQ